jgi:large subunit ribosomal protein L25
MDNVALPASTRNETGKGPARRLRASGKVPAIFYGKKSDPIKFAVDAHELGKLLEQAGSNPLFDLQISGDGKVLRRTAMLKERQVNPVDGAILHLDFLEVFMDEAVEVAVPLEFVGKCVGVERGGIFQSGARDLRVSCLPQNLPNLIEVDISLLDVGHAIHAKDLPIPAGVTLLTEPDQTIATVISPKRGELAEVEEGEAAAEGAATGPESE